MDPPPLLRRRGIPSSCLRGGENRGPTMLRSPAYIGCWNFPVVAAHRFVDARHDTRQERRLPEGEPQAIIVDGHLIVTAAVFERAAAERPTHDTIEGIANWLTADARRAESFLHMFDELAWRLRAAGIPLLRASLHSGTLHPQFLGATYLWWRDTGQTHKVMVTHELGDTLTYDNNPVRRV